ncbi:MAG: glycosyl hydrolase [Verrucomicrobiae bacterium]|nr:glycosyl hydrolase [Verrucomicrobiae bacterium]
MKAPIGKQVFPRPASMETSSVFPFLFIFLFWLMAPLAAQNLQVPEKGAYLGAYIEGGETEDDITLKKLLAFERLSGKPQAIVAFSSFWGQDEFPAAQIKAIAEYGAIPLIFWSPWGVPYEETEPQPEYSPARIAAGEFDGYIVEWLNNARKTKTPLLVDWGLEMNGDWFPWSPSLQDPREKFNSGSKPLTDSISQFIAAWKRIVDIARREKITNIQWVFHTNNFSFPQAKWNTMAAYYPGDDYVDWIGLSAYGMMSCRSSWQHLYKVLDKPYEELVAVTPNKPIMLAEWGVGEFPQQGNKADFFTTAFEHLKTRYPRLKAAIYWHERWQEPNHLWSNLRINSSPRALNAYRIGIQDPFWISRPIFEKPSHRK